MTLDFVERVFAGVPFQEQLDSRNITSIDIPVDSSWSMIFSRVIAPHWRRCQPTFLPPSRSASDIATSYITTSRFLCRSLTTARMTNLRLQKRLAASIKGVGKRRVWLDPNEASEISLANSRQAVRKLIKARTIIVKPVKIHSRYRKNQRDEAKRKGRHTGACFASLITRRIA